MPSASVLVVFLHFMLFSLTGLNAKELHVLPWDQSIAGRDLSITIGDSGKKSIPIERMHFLKRSKLIEIPDKAQSIGIVVNDRKTEEGEPVILPVNIESGMTRALILLVPDAKSPAGIKSQLIDDSEAGFGYGSMRFINLTGQPLDFKSENKNYKIASGGKPATIQTSGGKRKIDAAIYRGKKRMYSSIWFHNESVRKLIFILPGKDKSHSALDFKFIIENKSSVENERRQANKK